MGIEPICVQPSSCTCVARARQHGGRGGLGLGVGRQWLIAADAGEAEAIERFRMARSLAPTDPLNFLAWHRLRTFQVGTLDQSARWFQRALAENPAAVWINHYLTPAYAGST